jgi:signal transduction histidine kinase
MEPSRQANVARALARPLVVVSVLLSAGGLTLAFVQRSTPFPEGTEGNLGTAVVMVVFLPYSVMGALILSRQPSNRIGWIFGGMGLAFLLSGAATQYSVYALVTRHGDLPGGVVTAWLSGWVIGAGIMGAFLLLLMFPDGRLLSRRWVPLAAAFVGGALMLTAGFALAPGKLLSFESMENPYGFRSLRFLSADTNPGWVVFPLAVIGGFASVVIRYRRSGGEERQRVKLLIAAAAFLAVALAFNTFLSSDSEGPPPWSDLLLVFALTMLPVAAGAGILRHQLYGIDVVVSRALVYGALAASITALYLGIVVGIGTLIGSSGNVVLSLAATVVVAATFQPLRERAGRLANRLVYGRRATPYEVLSEFSERMGETYALDDVLPRMARILGEGTGADRAQVWLKTPTGFRRAAGWPEGDGIGDVVPAAPNEEWPDFGLAAVAPVRHQGELLGVLTLSKPPSDPVNPDDRRLLSDLASQAGLVLNNVRLTEELRARLEELRASRQRIVTAQDQERRRLERNIHDGAQQQLVALAVRARLADAVVDKDPAKAHEILELIQTDLNEALDDLRELARGIYPPLLADKGLAEALRSQARKAVLPVVVEADGIGRYPQEIEATVYFCTLEAIQNVSKYAKATRADIRLYEEDASLVFAIQDDGVGFDSGTVAFGSGLRNMADRLAAIDGTLELRSQPGAGTTVLGRIPIGDRSGSRP